MALRQVARGWEAQIFLSRPLWPSYKALATLHQSSVVIGSTESGCVSTTRSNSSGGDMVGTPDPVSNIRPLRLREPANAAEKEVQELKLQMWALKHEFWTQHNTQFKKEKAEYAERVLQSKRVTGELTDEDDVSQVTSEELSAFYKDFLDKKYHDQMIFTKNWMRLNLLLTWTQLKYSVKTLFRLTR